MVTIRPWPWARITGSAASVSRTGASAIVATAAS
jgi:hypothetical protein